MRLLEEKFALDLAEFSHSSFIHTVLPYTSILFPIIMKFPCSVLLAISALSVLSQEDILVLAHKKVKTSKAPAAKKAKKGHSASTAAPVVSPTDAPSALPTSLPTTALTTAAPTCALVSISWTHRPVVNAMTSLSQCSLVLLDAQTSFVYRVKQ